MMRDASPAPASGELLELESTPSATVERLRALAPLLVVFLCAFAVNANTLLNDFVYDDVSQVLDNNWITSVKYLGDIFSHDATHAGAVGTSNYYRPIMNLVYMANYSLFGGLQPWGFHLVNVLFHGLVAVLVYLMAAELLRDQEGPASSQPWFSAPLVAALIFAVHPANTEVVAWVACIPELTFTLCCLVTLRFHMRSRRLFDKEHLLSIAAFTVALFCKETAVTVVPMLVLYDLACRRERGFGRNLARYAVLTLPVVLYAALRLHALGGMAPMKRHPELNAYETVINIVPLFGQYLGKLLLPIGQRAFYVLHPVRSVLEPGFLAWAAVVIVFLAAGVILFRKNRAAFLSLALVAVPLLPVLYIRGLGENTFADRYLYFPSVGFALLAGMIFTSKRFSVKISAGVLVAVLACYGVATAQRNAVWRDEMSLWTDTVRKSPDSFQVRAQLGSALNASDDMDGAGREYQEGMRLCSERMAMLRALDASKTDRASIASALKECNEGMVVLHNGLGLTYLRKGNLSAAVNEYRAALALKDNYTSHVNLGNIFYNNHNDAQAANEYLQAIKLDSNSYEAHNNLGSVYLSNGQVQLAINEYRQALALNPNYEEARKNLAAAMAKR